MSSWKKENKMRLKVTYTLDKYRESDNYLDTLGIVEGEMAYVNTPMASTFLNIETDEGEFISISRDLILKVEWIKLPSWSMLTEEQVVDAAKMRLKNLDMEIKMQKQQFDQEERMEKSKQEGVN